MKDQEIVDTVIACVKHAPSLNNESLAIYWSGEHNSWKCTDLTKLDPLSWILYCLNMEPCYDGDDNLAIATLARRFNRSANWVKSFHLAVNGKANSGTSISGYVLGLKVRKELCTRFQKELAKPLENL